MLQRSYPRARWYVNLTIELFQNGPEQITSFENLNQNNLAKNNFEGDFVNMLFFRVNFQKESNLQELLSPGTFLFSAKISCLQSELKWTF